MTAGLHSWLAERRQDVDAALERWVPASGCEPDFVWDAMRYSLMAGGKRLRPLLAMAAAEAVAARDGHDADDARALALPVACALELIHTYSLVHDDLPAMDNDVLRRGRPTAHVVYGEGMAILSGDALLTEAFALLAREPQRASIADADLATRKIAAIGIIASAAGACGMVGGQAIDLRAVSPGAAALDAAALRDMHARKTGALIRASCLAGAAMAGADERTMAGIAGYGEQLGLAFQIMDDVLDVSATSADLGKTAGKDAAAGKPTYVSLYGLDGARQLAADSVSRALASLSTVGVEGQLPVIAWWVLDRHN